MTFREKLAAAQQQAGSTLAIGLTPALDKLPAEIASYDDPFLPLGKAIIDATGDLVCAYVFHLGDYLSTGAAGAVALERTIAYVPRGLLKILHGPFANGDYVRAAFEDAFGADAVTLAPGVHPAPYVAQPDHGAFVLEGHALLPELSDQVGVCRLIAPEHSILTLGRAEIHWYWGTHVYRSRRTDFADVLRAAVMELRQPR